MMTDLFSSMDGASKIYLWIPSLIFMLAFFTGKLNSKYPMGPILQVGGHIWANKDNQRHHSFIQMLRSVFFFLMLLNFLGLSPFVYTLTSNLFVMLSLGLMAWGLIILSGYFKDPQSSFAHMAPQGAPIILIPFLVLIELISTMIRPLTLTVRLIANISAGHIVIGLLANTLTALTFKVQMLPLIVLTTFYMLFEFFVAAIQAYIFTLLVSLYQAEHP